MLNLLLNEDEAMIAESVRQFLAEELPLERLRPKAAVVDNDSIYRDMARLGWFGVGLSEAAGGSGLGLVEEMLIQREFGRYVASPSTLAAVLAGHVAAEAGDNSMADSFATGEARAGLALLLAETGSSVPVLVFDRRDRDTVVAWTQEGIGLFGPDALNDLRDDDCIDDSISMQVGTLSPDKALHWVAAEKSDLILRTQLLLAAALSGLADQSCNITVEYAKVREQFGQPIGGFQAVKHRCADMGMRARLAWYQTNVAALKLEAGEDDAALQVASALLVATEAAHENGRAGIQIHGGIGFQAECDIHWFMKRAHIYDRLAGGREAVAHQVLNQPALF